MARIFDETRTLRRRLQGVQERGRISPTQHASYAQVVQVYDAGHIPTTVPNQFAVKPVRVTGAIAEGAAATTTAGTTGFIATILGPHVPVAGDRFVVRQAGGRWVADGGETQKACSTLCVTVHGCGTTNPDPIVGATVTAIQGGVTVATGVTVGQITGINLGTSGGGYTPGSPPAVTIAGGGGTGASAVAVMNSGGTNVAGFFMTNFGTGYTGIPTVTVDPPPSGGTTATGTAVFAARACLGILNTGTTTISVTKPAGLYGAYASTTTTTVTLNCIANTATVTVAAGTQPAAPSGYHNAGTSSCTPYTCCPTSEQTGPYYYSPNYPNTLYLNDGFGMVTLTWNSGLNQWVGCATRTASGTRPCGDCSTLSAFSLVPADVPVQFGFSCGGGTSWTLRMFTAGVIGGDAYPSDGTCNPTTGSMLNCCGVAVVSGGAQANAPVASCSSFSWSGSVDFGAASAPGIQKVYGTGAIGMTITQ